MKVKYKLNGREVSAAEFDSHDVGDRLKVMLESGTPPMSNSDREFLEGTHRQFEKTPHMGDWYKRQAEAQGVNVTGKVYLSGLAAYPGDPRAWVSGRGDVQRVCEERGWASHGSVNVKMREPDAPPQEVALARDIVDQEVRARVEASPEPVSAGQVEAIRDAVVRDRTPHWAAG